MNVAVLELKHDRCRPIVRVHLPNVNKITCYNGRETNEMVDVFTMAPTEFIKKFTTFYFCLKCIIIV